MIDCATCTLPYLHTHTQVLCKPKILPLKSVTLEKLENMQKEVPDEFAHGHMTTTGGPWQSSKCMWVQHASCYAC